jgi:hypothetical protein
MNRQLKRIEQTLQKLEKGSTPVPAVHGGKPGGGKTGRGATRLASPDGTSDLPQSDRGPADRTGMPAQSSVSFELHRRSGAASAPGTMAQQSAISQLAISESAIISPAIGTPMPDGSVSAAGPVSSTSPMSPSRSVQPFVAEGADQAGVGAKFQLPTFANPAVVGNLGFSTHQNRSNPDIALNLLQDTLKTVEAWRHELTQVVRQIQDLYREGPIVDGWLECSTQKVNDTTQVLRHAEVNQLMDYVGELCNDPAKTHPEYRLCGLNAEGKTWSSPCPPEQIASLSLAISRHQKLKPLLLRRSALEKQLSHVAEEVVKMQSRIPGINEGVTRGLRGD